jgi:photosystem II stability/assembly factor-like uncharacterized protein
MRLPGAAGRRHRGLRAHDGRAGHGAHARGQRARDALHGIATDKGLYEDPGRLDGAMHNALLRSRDDGRTWQRIPLSGVIDASEGFPYVDARTGRLFVTSFSSDTTRCGQPVIYSDDEGEHWTAAAERPRVLGSSSPRSRVAAASSR